jgi:hypothetical protein
VFDDPVQKRNLIMRRIMNLGCWASVACVALLVTVAPLVAADPPPVRRDARKLEIEGPTEALLALRALAAQSASDNPKVQPGKVKWHANFADACAAAQKSGKPVLLFQMMGKLDDQFC